MVSVVQMKLTYVAMLAIAVFPFGCSVRWEQPPEPRARRTADGGVARRSDASEYERDFNAGLTQRVA